MRDRVSLVIWVTVSLIVGYHLRWLHVEFDKYLDYKKPKELICKRGIVYEQVDTYSSVYVRNDNLTCVEKNDE